MLNAVHTPAWKGRDKAVAAVPLSHLTASNFRASRKQTLGCRIGPAVILKVSLLGSMGLHICCRIIFTVRSMRRYLTTSFVQGKSWDVKEPTHSHWAVQALQPWL